MQTLFDEEELEGVKEDELDSQSECIDKEVSSDDIDLKLKQRQQLQRVAMQLEAQGKYKSSSPLHANSGPGRKRKV